MQIPSLLILLTIFFLLDLHSLPLQLRLSQSFSLSLSVFVYLYLSLSLSLPLLPFSQSLSRLPLSPLPLYLSIAPSIITVPPLLPHSLSPFLTIPLFTVILSGLFLPLISLHLSNSVILYSSPSLTSNLVKSWMVALGEFTLSVIPLQPAIPPPFLPTSYDKFLQYGMECQQAFTTFREKIPQSVRQILMLIEFLIVYSAAISWVVHLPLAVGRVGLKYTRYVLADSRTC